MRSQKYLFRHRLSRKKPELKYTSNGTPYTRFNVACNFSYSRDSQRVDGVDWSPFIASGNLAEIAKVSGALMS